MEYELDPDLLANALPPEEAAKLLHLLSCPI